MLICILFEIDTGGINIVCACLVDKIIEYHQNAKQLLQLCFLQQWNLLLHLSSLSPAMPSRGNQADEGKGRDQGMRRQQVSGEAKISPRPS